MVPPILWWDHFVEFRRLRGIEPPRAATPAHEAEPEAEQVTLTQTQTSTNPNHNSPSGLL